ncbi:MAG TPA: hypothetical protein VLT85_13850 [Terriglobales bacterium]|nr:hypothetical protein [Terriglobales bacterium]
MNLSLIAAALLLLWLLMPCLLSPATFGRVGPSAPPRLQQREQPRSASDTLARLYRRPPLAGSQFSVPGSQSQKSERPRPMTRP